MEMWHAEVVVDAIDDGFRYCVHSWPRYVVKHPQPKGQPYGREHKLLWTSLFVSFCCTIAAVVAMFVLTRGTAHPAIINGRHGLLTPDGRSTE